MHPFYVMRALRGMLLIGALVMVYNCWHTIRGEVRAEEPMARPAPAPAESGAPRTWEKHAIVEKSGWLLVAGIL